MSGRRVCPKCGTLYNAVSRPPKTEGICDLDGTALVVREDDREEVVRARLEEYEAQTRPLIDYYRQRDFFHEVDGDAEPEAITRELCRFLKGHDHLQVPGGN